MRNSILHEVLETYDCVAIFSHYARLLTGPIRISTTIRRERYYIDCLAMVDVKEEDMSILATHHLRCAKEVSTSLLTQGCNEVCFGNET